jgi:hypothetical protein
MSNDFASRMAAADALEEAVAWHTLGIVASSEQYIGTGAALSWKNHSLIVTAGHVIDDTRIQDLWFFLRPEGTLRRVDNAPAIKVENLSFEIRKRIPIQHVRFSRYDDLAIMEVHHRFVESERVKFHLLKEDSVTPKVGQTVLVMGYPFDLTKVVRKGELAAFTSVEWTSIQETIALHNHDPGSHFLMPYDSAEEGRNPKGFSGGGVWYRRAHTPAIWHPNLALAGICVSYFPRSHFLEAVRIERLFSALRETYPDG